MVTDLEAKAGKYENKATKCKEWADQTQGAQREFYDILAFYYGDPALAFRQAIARRRATQVHHGAGPTLGGRQALHQP